MAKSNIKANWESRTSYAEKYLRWFVDYCPVPIAMFDYNLRYILVSQSWVKMLGTPRLKLIGRNIDEFLPISPVHKLGIERCLNGDQMQYVANVELQNRHGVVSQYQWQVHPWYDDNGVTGGVVLSSNLFNGNTDTTILENKNLETQLESLRHQLSEEVSERQSLEASFHKLGTALECATDAICITNSLGVPIYTNAAFSDLFSYSLFELQQPSRFQSLFIDMAIAQSVYGAVLHGGTWSGELEMRDRQGQSVPVSLKAAPVNSMDGQFLGSTYICTNIRDRVAAEAEINKSFAVLGATLEATADGILVLDASGNIIICNQKFVDLMQIPQRIFAAHNDALVLQYLAKRIMSSQYLQDFGSTLARHQNSFEIVKLDDGRTLECYSQPQHLFDSYGGRVWSLRDITERLAADALMRSSEEKYRLQAAMLEEALQELKSAQSQLIQSEKMSGLGQLVAGIAHEINNPVNFIYGNLAYADSYTKELLELVEFYRRYYPEPVPEITAKLEEMDIDFLASDFVKLVSSIRIGAERIQKIVQSLNKFSRSDEEGFKFVDIHEGIDSTLLILQSRFKATSQRPEILLEKLYGDVPAVECVAGQLNQVFMNLISNAIDALEEDALQHGVWQMVGDRPQWSRDDGKISKITIQTAVKRGKSLEVMEGGMPSEGNIPNVGSHLKDSLVVKISDSGGGIPEALSNRIFDLFFTTKPVGKGTGLGLSISYQIVTENHNGKLSFHSEMGVGTEFVIEVPLLQGAK
jgi:PAS domain S-box-containing protein